MSFAMQMEQLVTVRRAAAFADDQPLMLAARRDTGEAAR